MASSDHARFEAVVLPHLDAAYTLARYLTRNEHDAEDVVQEACLRALRHFAGFHGEEEASARAWLLTIVRNAAYSGHRRQRVGAATMEFDEEQHSGAVEEDTPEADLLRREGRDALGRAIAGLDPEFREVIILREVQGLSYKEISSVAGVPIGTVMSRLSRARQRLQDALGGAEQER